MTGQSLFFFRFFTTLLVAGPLLCHIFSDSKF